jgi:ribose transport system substrate-binding protein
MAPVIKETWNKGLFLVSNTNRTKDGLTPHVGWNYYYGGYLIGKAYGNRWPNDKVVVLKGPPGAEWAFSGGEGMIDALKEFPGIKILADKHHDMARPAIMSLAEDMLTAFSEVNGFVSYTDFQAKAAVAALRSAGFKPGQVKTTGNPINTESYKLMKDGWFNIALGSATVQIGRLSVWALVHMLEGHQVPAAAHVPLTIITEDNIDELEPMLEGLEWHPEGWTPPAQMK